jgi:hypothetical protein
MFRLKRVFVAHCFHVFWLSASNRPNIHGSTFIRREDLERAALLLAMISAYKL